MGSASVLMWGMLFGAIGFGYFVYGKKQGAYLTMICGVVLIIIPYFISNLYAIVLSGVALTALPFIVKKYSS